MDLPLYATDEVFILIYVYMDRYCLLLFGRIKLCRTSWRYIAYLGVPNSKRALHKQMGRYLGRLSIAFKSCNSCRDNTQILEDKLGSNLLFVELVEAGLLPLVLHEFHRPSQR